MIGGREEPNRRYDYAYKEIEEVIYYQEDVEGCSRNRQEQHERSKGTAHESGGGNGSGRNILSRLFPLLCIASWFTCSISLTVYNKWLFSPSSSGGLGFPFPITVTMFHMFSNATLAWCVHFIGVLAGRVSVQQQQQQQYATNQKRHAPTTSLRSIMTMTFDFLRRWKFDLASLWSPLSSGSGTGCCVGLRSKVCCCTSLLDVVFSGFLLSVLFVSLVSGFDIALTNTSFIYLDASLVEVIKPSNVLFVLVIGIVLKMRVAVSRTMVGSVLLIVVGQVLITMNVESGVDVKGMEIVLLATFMSAVRMVLFEVLLHGGTGANFLSLPRKLTALELVAMTMPGAGAVLAIATKVPYKLPNRLCEDYPQWCPISRDTNRTESDSSELYSEFYILSLNSGTTKFDSNDDDGKSTGSTHDATSLDKVFTYICYGALLAFMLNVSELGVVQCTDSLTTSLLGVVKLLLLFIATNVMLGEHFGNVQLAGVALVIGGMLL